MCPPETCFLFHTVMVVFMAIRWPMQKGRVEECGCQLCSSCIVRLALFSRSGGCLPDRICFPTTPLMTVACLCWHLAVGREAKAVAVEQARLSGQHKDHTLALDLLSLGGWGCPFSLVWTAKTASSNLHHTIPFSESLWLFQNTPFFLLYILCFLIYDASR